MSDKERVIKDEFSHQEPLNAGRSVQFMTKNAKPTPITNQMADGQLPGCILTLYNSSKRDRGIPLSTAIKKQRCRDFSIVVATGRRAGVRLAGK